MLIGRNPQQISYKEAKEALREAVTMLHGQRRELLDEVQYRRPIIRNKSRELKHWVSTTPHPYQADSYFELVKSVREQLVKDGVFKALNESPESKRFHALDRWGDIVTMSRSKGANHEVDLTPKNGAVSGRRSRSSRTSDGFFSKALDLVFDVLDIFT